MFALLPAQYAACVSSVLCLHYCQHSVLCVCKSFVVFALLPVQCAVCVSPVLCLYYFQCSVLSEDCVKSLVVFAQCTASTVRSAGAMISPLIMFILLFFTHSH